MTPWAWRKAMTLERRVTNIYDAPYTTYDLDGPVQKDMQLLNISYSKDTGLGWYVIRMAPGAATIPHAHESREEYLILKGDLIESDGTVLKEGDFVNYAPGTHHNSRTDNGCLLIGLNRAEE